MPDRIIEAASDWVRLPSVARALAGARDPVEVVEIIVHQGMTGLDADGGILALVGPDGVVLPVVTVGYTHRAVAELAPLNVADELPLTTAARTAQAVWVRSREDARTRFPQFADSGAMTSDAWAAIPLTMAGKAIAVLGVSFHAARDFTTSERLFLETVADLGTLALTGNHDPDAIRVTPAIDLARRENRTASFRTLGRLDNAINQAFAASMTLRGVADQRAGDTDLVNRLGEVITSLDVAIRECRTAALSIIV